MTGSTAVAAAVRDRITDGLAVGLIGAALVAVVAVVVRRRHPNTAVAVAGPALAVAAVVALERAGPDTLVDGRLRLGIALLVLGPTVVAILTAVRPVGPALAAALGATSAVPGAFVTAAAVAAVTPQPWARPLVVITVVVGGAAVTATDRDTASSGTALVCLVGTLVACFTTVPDTEQAGVLVGVAVPFAALAVPTALARVGPGGYAVAGLLAWTAAVGGTGRPGSAMGAVAGLGVLLTFPVARLLRSDLRPPDRPLDLRWWSLVALQATIVLLTARVAGLRDSLLGAAVVGGGVLVLAVPATVATGVRRRNDRPDPDPYHGGG